MLRRGQDPARGFGDAGIVSAANTLLPLEAVPGKRDCRSCRGSSPRQVLTTAGGSGHRMARMTRAATPMQAIAITDYKAIAMTGLGP